MCSSYFAPADPSPCLAERGALASAETSLWELVARASVHATEEVLRRGLLSGYRDLDDEPRLVRGRIRTLPTARNYYAGRLALACTYEEFDVDTPFNRVLKAAARSISGSAALPFQVRRLARRVVGRMDDVGPLERDDLHVPLERRLGHYRDAVDLACHVLRGQGRGISSGGLQAWSFLIRTPEMIETGLRNLLRKRLDPHWGDPRKRSIRAAGSPMSFNPKPVQGELGR